MNLLPYIRILLHPDSCTLNPKPYAHTAEKLSTSDQSLAVSALRQMLPKHQAQNFQKALYKAGLPNP